MEYYREAFYLFVESKKAFHSWYSYLPCKLNGSQSVSVPSRKIYIGNQSDHVRNYRSDYRYISNPVSDVAVVETDKDSSL